MRVLSGREGSQPECTGESAAGLDGLERLHLIMGLQCNAGCIMCYQTEHGAEGNMPPALYAERLASAYPRVRTVKLQGGEPTIMRNCRELAAILRAFPRVGIALSTNGINLDTFWQETLLTHGEKVDVSLNAASEGAYRNIVLRGNYRRVFENVRALAAARQGKRPALAISLVILKENLFELHDFVDLGNALGVDAVKFAVDPILSFSGLPRRDEVLAEIGRVEEACRRSKIPVHGFESFGRRFGTSEKAAVARPQRCRLPFGNLVVAANGEVRACVMTWQLLGNLYETPLEGIWNGPAARRLRAKVGSGDHSLCEPYCPENANPSRLALARKYVSYIRRDPVYFVRKAHQKVRLLLRGSEPTASANGALASSRQEVKEPGASQAAR